MSLLPERKKSAEEIAKLRESLGIAGAPAAPEIAEIAPARLPVIEPAPLPPEPVAKLHAELEPALPPPAVVTLPAHETHEAKPVRSLKRSERIPVLPVDEGVTPQATTALSVPSRAVRSLRKSEQVPLATAPQPPPDSKLPHHRHNDRELNEIRRHEALAKLGSAPPQPRLAAHLATIVPGYLAAAVAVVYFWFFDVARQDGWVTASCSGLAFLIAGFIYFKRPFSRHHAAFIAVVALLAAVFGALYYFPQLRHGT